MSDLVRGADGLARCRWAVGVPIYEAYHDEEWGRPVHGDEALFERITLEAFQSGLSWLIILRKREAFREAFARFDIERVARFGVRDRNRLLADVGIVRNRAKIDAAINNARALAELRDAEGEGAFDRLIWSHQPTKRARPRRLEDISAKTPDSIALTKALKAAGLVFVGPTTAYAAMQAIGLVDDHLRGCHVPARTATR